jgi:hypothetical protein
MVTNAYNFVFSSLIHLVGNSVDDQQVVRLGDPNKNGSTDPTHSQLAKDHDNHPFHVIAAILAKEAVEQVGKAMAARWWNGNATIEPAAIAAKLIAHPFDTTWQDALVATWAAKHPQEIKRGESSTEWEALEKAHKKEILDTINKSRKNTHTLWNYVNEYYQSIFGEANQVKK